MGRGALEEKDASFRIRDDDGVAAPLSMSNVDWTSETVWLARLGEGVEDNDAALLEDCRPTGGSPPRLNNLPE